jgi:aryl-alcohol dehydrogenase-like predicted oxidoreductase
MSRGVEAAILPTCRDLGIGITAYGVLSRGLLGGEIALAGTAGDIRSARLPRFQGDNLARNLALAEKLRAVAAAHGATPAQAAIAWALSRDPAIVPVIGTRRRQRLAEALSALELRLDPAALAEIDAAVPPEQVAGERYDPAQMAHLDSER